MFNGLLKQRGSSATWTLACTLLLTSCSPFSAPGEEASGNSIPSNMPDFTGPCAPEFRESYSRASSDEVRGYLSDEVITEAETQAVTEAFRNCMTSNGLRFNNFAEDVSYDFEFAAVADPKRANEIANTCEAETGVIDVIYLYYMIQANPDNHDQSAEITACLIRSGVVPADYTVEKFHEKWVSEYAIANEFETAMAEKECDKDPVGAFNG